MSLPRNNRSKQSILAAVVTRAIVSRPELWSSSVQTRALVELWCIFLLPFLGTFYAVKSSLILLATRDKTEFIPLYLI